jgi:hypothetical protein
MTRLMFSYVNFGKLTNRGNVKIRKRKVEETCQEYKMLAYTLICTLLVLTSDNSIE